ncbi:MAG TPA: DUF2333 family protein [Candidatus Binatia bacterium]|nr:DUF2333 family protein [Candidatus Binatia bacterium]
MLRAAAGAILVVIFLIVPLFLHFTQKRHNELPFRIETEFPADRALVGGEVYASTLAALLAHELESSTGWRPNDFFLWGPGLTADNNSNRQLGIIQALRDSTRVFRDHLTKVSASEYDQNLVDADTRLRNDEHKFWFPSAESRFRDGVQSLRAYVAGLSATPPASKPINRRNVELIRLFQTWTDMLGDAHANLLREDVGFLQTDDHFYHAQGMAHVMFHLTMALRREYQESLAGREAVLELFDHVAHSLREAAWIKPLVVMDGSPGGLFANHRRNLDVFIIDARQLMYTIREELEK